MRGRISILAASAAFAFLAGCGDEPAAPAASRPTDAPRRIALIAFPLTADVPPTWDVRRGPGGTLVLSGRAPSGVRDLALSVGPRVPTFELPATQPATPLTPGGRTTVRVDDRDGMRIVERIERVGAIDQPAESAPVRWSVRFIVAGDGGLDVPAYDFDAIDLTQISFERDEATIRAILDTVRPPAADRPASAPSAATP